MRIYSHRGYFLKKVFSICSQKLTFNCASATMCKISHKRKENGCYYRLRRDLPTHDSRRAFSTQTQNRKAPY